MWYTITISKVATMWSNVICFKVNDIFIVCLFSVFVRFENFLSHMQTSPACTPNVTRVIRLQWSFPKTPDTATYCRAFGSGAFST